MANTPAFQFYASDFLTSTQSWDVNEVGIYIRLLSNQWVNFRLPKETERLARIAGCEHDLFKKAWVTLGFKFIEGEDGFLRNEKLESVREQKEAFLEKQRLNGLRGGRPKKNNPNETQSITQSITQTKPKAKPTYNPNHNPKITSSTSLIDINIYSDFSFFNNGFELVWKDFKELRLKLKKPLTTTAERLNLLSLSKLCDNDKELAIKIVNQTIQNGWQGFFPLKEESQNNFKQQFSKADYSNVGN